MTDIQRYIPVQPDPRFLEYAEEGAGSVVKLPPTSCDRDENERKEKK